MQFIAALICVWLTIAIVTRAGMLAIALTPSAPRAACSQQPASSL